MDNWKWITLLLCGFGLLKELRPSESFITEYLMEFKNMSSSTIIHEIYPISTYTILATVVLIFLVTDFVRHRPIVILEACCLVITWAVLIWANTFEAMIVVEIFYGIAASANVAYYTYIYSQVSKDHYKKVTAYTYGSALVGKFLAGILGQLLISFKIMNFHQLNYISLVSVSMALVLALFLPQAKKSQYFNREEKVEQFNDIKDSESTVEKNEIISGPSPDVKTQGSCTKISQRIQHAYPILWTDFKEGYSRAHVVKWSFWWALASAGNLQVTYYSTALWESIDLYTNTEIYNGAVATVQCLLSAVASFAVGHVKVNWKSWGEPFLCIVSTVQGIVIIWMSQTGTLWIAYLNYIIFRVLFQLVITIASAEIVHGINDESSGLIFGMNTFVALIFQSLLTLIVADKNGLALQERTQFFVYGSYFVVLGIFFFVAAIWMIVIRCYGRQKLPHSDRSVSNWVVVEEYQNDCGSNNSGASTRK